MAGRPGKDSPARIDPRTLQVVEALADSVETKQDFSEFELEFNALVRKHFPHWQALDISQL